MTVLVMVSSCHSSADRQGLDPIRRGRELTRQLYAGAFDSLPRSAILDLGGAEDTVLLRWFLSRLHGPLGREWPTEPLLALEGPASGHAYLGKLDSAYGHELAVIREAAYRCYQPLCELPESFEYNRIVRFSRYPGNTLTIAWLWAGDSLVGGWIIPSHRAAPTEFGNYQATTRLQLPFSGEWVVLWGGTEPYENYHAEYPPVRFAYDFVVDSAGSLQRTTGSSNADYFCYGQPILTPAPGRVAIAIDSFPENAPGTAPAGYRGPGNFVAIDHGNGETSILAHLRRGSMRVAAGERVEVGDTVAQCGNNGESMLPHLHYQLQLGAPPAWHPVPAPFDNFEADGMHVARGIPTRGQHVTPNRVTAAVSRP